jgi:hypothetical protein
MESRTPKDQDSRKRKPHARPDRIIEKRQNWKDYLHSDEEEESESEFDEMIEEEESTAEEDEPSA